MSIIDDIIGNNSSSYDREITGFQILDDIYSFNAVILQNALEILGIPLPSSITIPGLNYSIGVPLIGLTYKTEGEVELLSYEWSEYPYLSKTLIVNSGIKQATNFQLDCYSVISGINPVALNLIKVQKIVEYLDNYMAKGGLFTVKTLYGDIADCVIEKVVGVTDESSAEGTHLKLYFKKPNIDQIGTATQQVRALVGVANGGGATDWPSKIINTITGLFGG